MNKIKNVLYFLTLYYPYSEELSKTRLTKMVYLADWYSVTKYRQQLTNIKWYFNHYGPFVTDVYEEVVNDKYLSIENSYSAYGTPKEIIKFNTKYREKEIKLSQDEKEILTKVIDDTKMLTWSDFIDKIYSTYPIRNQERYTELDLVQLAKEALKHV